MSIRELRVIYLPTINGPHLPDIQLNRPADMARFFVPLLVQEPVEVCAVLCLTTRHVPLAYHIAARGSLSSCIVEPGQIYRAALLANAAAIAVAHNHPSGDPNPSADDIALTRRLQAAGVLIGITFLDHIIVGEHRYFSFQEQGQL